MSTTDSHYYLMDTILISILSGSLTAALVSGLFSIYTQKSSYKNEYYKYVIKKRIEAYERIEEFIVSIKGVVYDETDHVPYHMIFGRDYNWFIEQQSKLWIAISFGTWIENDTLAALTALNRMFIDIKPIDNLVVFGKDKYIEIAILRDKIENLSKREILSLYDIKAFRKKKTETIFVHI